MTDGTTSSEPDGPAPPYDLKTERTVLRAMLRSADAIAEIVEILDGSEFYRPAHELIYNAALEVYARGETPDPLNVAAELATRGQLESAGGAEYLTTVVTGAPGKGWNKAAGTVQALAVLRRTQQAAVHIENLVAEAAPNDVERIVETAQAEIFAATARRPGLPPTYSLGEVLEETLDDAEAVGSRRGLILGVPTGFADLDSLTGGLQPGHLIVIAARPAMGKSTLAVDFLRSATIAHALPAALFTLESSRREVGMRIVAAEARVALHHMRGGTMTDDDWTKVARRMTAMAEAPLYIQDDAYATFSDLRAQCRHLHAQRDIRLIVVDAVHMLTYGTRPFAARYEEVSEISRHLKLLAKELSVPVVAVCDLNRGPEQRTDKKPILSDLRDSGALEDNADVVILLHREDAYDRGSPRAGEADLIVAKHRQGPTATICVAFQGHYSRFVDITQT
jgi:replicative DNA helicase